MTRLILSVAAVIGLSSNAFAQEAPYYHGDYDAAVSTQLNDAVSGPTPASPAYAFKGVVEVAAIDKITTASFPTPVIAEQDIYSAWQVSSGR